MKRKISYPQFANYLVPFSYFINKVFDAEFITPPPLTKKTLEIGSLHSPDFVCAPFKFQLGNYIEALEAGADTLIQIGGSCRLGYYGELQEQILRDLGYEFNFINLSAMDFFNPASVWAELKKYNSKLSVTTVASTLLICIEMVKQMDYLEDYIRENVGFEVIPGEFDDIYNHYLNDASNVKTKKELKKIYKIFASKIKDVEVNKPKKLLKVGIIGEYYTVMEPYSNHYIEKELASKGISVKRYMNLSSSLFYGGPNKIIKKSEKYVKYDIGATGVFTVNAALEMVKDKYDGIIHVKSFGCTPEIDTMMILQNISSDKKIPILYFSFDSQTSETGIKTRLEAFNDMIVMRSEHKE